MAMFLLRSCLKDERQKIGTQGGIFFVVIPQTQPHKLNMNISLQRLSGKKQSTKFLIKLKVKHCLIASSQTPCIQPAPKQSLALTQSTRFSCTRLSAFDAKRLSFIFSNRQKKPKKK